jgi:hypothetical protein
VALPPALQWGGAYFFFFFAAFFVANSLTPFRGLYLIRKNDSNNLGEDAIQEFEGVGSYIFEVPISFSDGLVRPPRVGCDWSVPFMTRWNRPPLSSVMI